MKKFRLLLVAFAVLMILSGCKTDQGAIDVEKPPVDTEKTVVKASRIPDEVYSWNRVSEYVGDIDGDGTDEKVVLMTSAERNEDGEFLWNDGQNWALYVDGKADYLFLKEYLNTGNVYFEVSDYYMKNGAKPKLNVIVSTGAGFSLKSYEFSELDEGYVEESVYSTKEVTEGGINRRFSSFPQYQNED